MLESIFDVVLAIFKVIAILSMAYTIFYVGTTGTQPQEDLLQSLTSGLISQLLDLPKTLIMMIFFFVIKLVEGITNMVLGILPGHITVQFGITAESLGLVTGNQISKN